MEHAAKVCANALSARPEKPTNESVQPELFKPRQIALRRLWMRMVSMYQHKWASACGDSPEDAKGMLSAAGDTWQRGLTGITDAQIARGLAACMASADSWPPSLPEFRKLCLEIPSLAKVRRDLRPGNAAPDGFTRLMWQYIDGWEFQSAKTERAERMVSEAYELACDHVMRGGSLPDAPNAMIEHTQEKPKPVDPERVRHWMAKCEDALEGRDETVSAL